MSARIEEELQAFQERLARPNSRMPSRRSSVKTVRVDSLLEGRRETG